MLRAGAPRLRDSRSTPTSGNRARTASDVPSDEALSTKRSRGPLGQLPQVVQRAEQLVTSVSGGDDHGARPPGGNRDGPAPEDTCGASANGPEHSDDQVSAISH